MKKRILSLVIALCMLAAVMLALPASAYDMGKAGELQTISAGDGHSTVVKNDGSLWAWGFNNSGQLGIYESKYSPTHIPTRIMEDVASVSAEQFYTAVIKSDGTLWAWGHNSYGQIGNGEADILGYNYKPFKIMEDVSALSSGGYHTAAIKTDGTLWLWGNNKDGQIGNGDSGDDVICPFPIKVMNDVVAVSAGLDHTAAIKTDGTLWLWGNNQNGQIGNGDSGDNVICPSPVKVMNDVIAVSAGCGMTAAIKTDGTLWLWGWNGNPFDENAKTINIPRKIMDNVSKVSIGENYIAVIKNDGSLWAWNFYNGSLESPDGSKIDFNETPVKIMDNIEDVSVGSNHIMMIKSDGTLWTMGYNGDGQLGDGTTEHKSTPVKIMDNVKLPGNGTNQPHSQSTSFSMPSTLTVTLGSLSPVLYARGQSGITFASDNNEVISLQSTNERSIFETAAVSGVYVTGLTPGKATITATAPDGSTAQCEVTVEGKIAETIDDELVLKAKICANNAEYQYMRDSYRDPSAVLVNGSNLYASKLYQNINDFIDFFNLSYSAADYYEIALMDIIQNDNTYYETVKDIIDNDFVRKLLDEANKKIHENMNANKVDVSGLNCFDIDKFFTDVSFLDAFFATKNVSESMYKKFEQIYALSLVTDEQIKALESVKATTLNDDIKKACDKVIKAQAEAAQETANEIAMNTAFAGFEELGEYVGKRGWNALINLIPGMPVAKVIVEGGKLVSNNLYNADKLSTDLLTMAATSEIQDAVKSAMKINEKSFLKNSSVDNALEFMAVADFYKAISIYGCDAALEFEKDLEYANAVQDAFKITSKIFPSSILRSISDLNDVLVKHCNSSTIEEFKNSVTSIRDMIDDYNFYNPYGNDISNYIRDVVSTTPSEWAKPYIEKAINYGLLDTDYQNNYQNNITRAEFCTLLTYLIDAKSDLTMDELAERAGRPDITVQFDDTLYSYVSDVARLGIINGTGNNKFEPLGEITRQQAARILSETAKVLGYDISAPESDLSGVADWAKEGVNFVVDKDIMTGTDNGFEPEGKYTKEQAITTMVRFYENLK